MTNLSHGLGRLIPRIRIPLIGYSYAILNQALLSYRISVSSILLDCCDPRNVSPMLLFPIFRVQFSCSVVSNSLQPHGLQHARPPFHHQLLELAQTHNIQNYTITINFTESYICDKLPQDIQPLLIQSETWLHDGNARNKNPIKQAGYK